MIFLQTHGFVKYSIPQPPGRQSVELVSCFGISISIVGLLVLLLLSL